MTVDRTPQSLVDSFFQTVTYFVQEGSDHLQIVGNNAAAAHLSGLVYVDKVPSKRF